MNANKRVSSVVSYDLNEAVRWGQPALPFEMDDIEAMDRMDESGIPEAIKQ